MPPACLKQAFRIVALDRCGNHSRSKRSRSNVPPKFTYARRFFARRSAELGRSLASEIFLTSLQTASFSSLLVIRSLSGSISRREPKVLQRREEKTNSRISSMDMAKFGSVTFPPTRTPMNCPSSSNKGSPEPPLLLTVCV